MGELLVFGPAEDIDWGKFRWIGSPRKRCPVCKEHVEPTETGRCPKCGDVVIVEVE